MATTAQAEAATTAHPPPATRRRWLPSRDTVLRLLGAVLAGGLLYASFPPRPLWWLAPLAIALFALVLHGRRARAGFGYGLVFGWAFFLPLVYWLQDFLGAEFGSAPWLAVSSIEAAAFALCGAAMTAVARLPAAPVWQAALLVGSESLRSRLPLSGFPWGRLGFGQPDGPLLSLASIGGAVLVAFAVALIGCGLAAVVLRWRAGARGLAGPVAAVLLPAVAAVALWPTIGTAASAGSLRVAVLQGNAPNIGLALQGADSQIRNNHLAAANRLAASIDSGSTARPDMVVLPETAFKLLGGLGSDPQLSSALRSLGVPSLVGAQVREGPVKGTNSMLSWNPRNGQSARYDKQELVPFSEYVPLRTIAAWFTPFVNTFGDLTPGTKPGVFQIAGTRVGTIICYEAAYDYPSRDAVNAGARLLVVPTNNAWFGDSEMSYQQLGMSRLRAVEHGRAVIVAATSGVSAVVGPDGSVREQTRLFTADTLLATVPLRDERTVADKVGSWPERVLVSSGLLGLAVGGVGAWRRRRNQA